MPWLRMPFRLPPSRLSAALIFSILVVFAVASNADRRGLRARADDAAATVPSLSGTLAYVADGNVYLSTSTSGPNRITASGDVASVRWSPGGTRLLIIRDRQTFAVAPDGGPALQIEGAWAPDDSVVAVAAADGGIDLIAPSEGGRRPLFAGTPDVAYQPIAWSPDGDTLALVRRQLNMKGLSTAESTWLVQRNGQGLRSLLPAGATWPHPLSFSPDGRWLAIQQGPAELCVSCRADGEQLDVVAIDGSRSFTMGTLLRADWLSWAPDSATVVASIGGGRETYRNKQLVTLDLTRGTLNRAVAPADTVEIQPTYSPAGTLLAFTEGAALAGPLFTNLDAQHGFPGVIAHRDVLVRPSDGSAARLLAGSAGWAQESPRWAGSQALLFVRWQSTADHNPPVGQLWLADITTGSETMLTSSLGAPGIPRSSFGNYGELGWPALFSWRP